MKISDIKNIIRDAIGSRRKTKKLCEESERTMARADEAIRKYENLRKLIP